MIVVDEQGKEYEATYKKRAIGLVKKGRARFINEYKICLACPPDDYLEDRFMEDNKNLKLEEAKSEEISISYLLKQIEAIRLDNTYILKAAEDMKQTNDIVIPEGCYNLGVVTKAEGWKDIVMARETTNQKMIEFYEKVYDDIKPRSKEKDMREMVIE